MITSSGDILNLVLAIAIVIFTTFIVIAIYYLISSIKGVYRIIHRLESSVSKVEDLIELIKGKVSSTSGHLLMFVELAKQAISFIQDNKKGQTTAEKVKKASPKKTSTKTKK